MRRAAAVALFALAACSNTALPVMNGRITTEDEFHATAVGKSISNSQASLAIHRYGRMSGSLNGTPYKGRWRWSEDGFFCRTISEPQPSSEDCQVWEITNRTLVITGNKGRGEKLIFPLPAPQEIARS